MRMKRYLTADDSWSVSPITIGLCAMLLVIIIVLNIIMAIKGDYSWDMCDMCYQVKCVSPFEYKDQEYDLCGECHLKQMQMIARDKNLNHRD